MKMNSIAAKSSSHACHPWSSYACRAIGARVPRTRDHRRIRARHAVGTIRARQFNATWFSKNVQESGETIVEADKEKELREVSRKRINRYLLWIEAEEGGNRIWYLLFKLTRFY